MIIGAQPSAIPISSEDNPLANVDIDGIAETLVTSAACARQRRDDGYKRPLSSTQVAACANAFNAFPLSRVHMSRA